MARFILLVPILYLVSLLALFNARIVTAQGTTTQVSRNCTAAFSILPSGYDIAPNSINIFNLSPSPEAQAAITLDQCCSSCLSLPACNAWILTSSACVLKTGTISTQQGRSSTTCVVCISGGIRINPTTTGLRAPTPAPGVAVPPRLQAAAPALQQSGSKAPSPGLVSPTRSAVPVPQQTGSTAPITAPITAPAPSPSPGAAIPGYDLYGEIKSYRAGSYNVTTQASSIWVAVNYTSGAAWNVTLPYFARILGGAGTTGGDFGGETVFPGSGSDGCLTVNVTSNTTSTVIVLLYDKSAAVPFSVCNGTCSKTTPLATGIQYSFALDNSARNSINATLKYVAYPTNHPVCVVALYSLPVSNALSMYTTNQTKSMPPSGLALDLGTGHTLQPGAFSILAAFSNSTCLRFSPTDTGNVSSVTVSLFSEGSLGFALRRGVDKDLTGSVNSGNRCSFGTDRDTSVPNCDVATGKAAFVKSMNPAIRYFLVAQNTGALRASFTMLKNPYSADSCQLNQVDFGEFRTVTTQTVTNAQQETAAQAATVLQAISRAIDANADHL